MPKPGGPLLSFRSRGIIGGHRRGWVPPIVAAVVSHLDLTDRDNEDHPKYGPLASGNTWPAWNVFTTGLTAGALLIPGGFLSADTFARINESFPPQTRQGLIIDLGPGAFLPANTVLGIRSTAKARTAAPTAAVAGQFTAGGINLNLPNAYGVRANCYFLGVGLTLSNAVVFSADPLTVVTGSVAVAYGFLSITLLNAVVSHPFYDAQAPTSGHFSLLRSTLQLFGAAPAFGGGVGVLGIANAAIVPTTNPANGGILYASAGALYWRGSGGTVTLVAAA